MNMPKISNPFSNMTGSNNIKKVLEEKNRERSKVYGFIGMDVYELYKQKKIEITELNVHFERMRELENEIAELEAEKQRLELQSKGSSICSCGQQLTSELRFCPRCGKPVDNGMLTCTCGKMIKKDTQFCPYCGRSVGTLIGNEQEPNAAGQQPPVEYRTCICGAKVPEGQFMCMECGRKME